MTSNRCCVFASRNSEGKTIPEPKANNSQKRLTFTQRCFGITGWALPGIALAILPKCPICLAGYIAIGTGIGLSITTATYLRLSLIILCIASLLYLVTKKLFTPRHQKQ